ncbi:MAG: ABC transporter substrate-binding protein [Chloroflexota bacterium]|nr:ABC transporter substrate-binding protein [Chloroflexota bacterium]
MTLAFSLALVLSGCAPAGTSSQKPSPSAAATPAVGNATAAATEVPAPVTVTMGLANNALFAPIFTGLQKGIFAKHGIDLKLSMVSAGTDNIRGLQGGQWQFSGTSWATFLPAATQGVQFRLFGLITGTPEVGNYDNQVALVVGPGFKGNTVADLKGAKIAVAVGTAPETWLRLVLRNAGLDPDKDVKLINVAVPNQLSTLQNKGADAAVPAEPYGTLMLEKVPGSKVLTRGGGLTDVRVNYVGMSSWVQQNAATAQKVMAASFEASQYVRLHPDEAAVATSHYINGIDLPTLTAAIKLLSFDPEWSDKVLASFEQSSRDMVANGSIKVAPKTTDFLDLDLLKLSSKYPQYFSDLKK